MNYKKQITTHLSLIDTLAGKRFPQSSLADEAVVYTLQKLQENHGQRLAGYTGASRFSSYLAVVVMRLFEDFSRKKFGRLRPPAWITRLGGMWLVLFRLLCLERKSFPQAVDEMVAYYQLSEDTADSMGSTILAEVIDCGHRTGQTIPLEEDERCAGSDKGGFLELEEKERILLFKALFQKVVATDPDNATSTHGLKLFELDFNLSGQEKILLKLCYQDGINVSKAGQMVGLTPHQTHGKMRRLLGRIRKILNESEVAASIKSFLVS